jgi:hypothetical protein
MGSVAESSPRKLTADAMARNLHLTIVRGTPPESKAMGAGNTTSLSIQAPRHRGHPNRSSSPGDTNLLGKHFPFLIQVGIG